MHWAFRFRRSRFSWQSKRSRRRDLVAEGEIIDPTAKAEALLENAIGTEDRKRILIRTNATTKQILDDAEQVRAGAQASSARARAKLAKATEQLGYAQVKADFAGVVTAVSAEVGQVVSPWQRVVTVARPEVREAVVDIGPDFPVPLSVGLPFTVSLELLPDVQSRAKSAKLRRKPIKSRACAAFVSR